MYVCMYVCMCVLSVIHTHSSNNYLSIPIHCTSPTHTHAATLPLRYWSEGHFPAPLLQAIEEAGYEKPSPIQRQGNIYTISMYATSFIYHMYKVYTMSRYTIEPYTLHCVYIFTSLIAIPVGQAKRDIIGIAETGK